MTEQLDEIVDIAIRQDPTTREGWLEREAEAGTPIVRSDVWSKPGRYDFELRHPATGRREWGTAATLPAAYEAMENILRGWFPNESNLDSLTVGRIVE